jgi:hypothetical protein
MVVYKRAHISGIQFCIETTTTLQGIAVATFPFLGTVLGLLVVNRALAFHTNHEQQRQAPGV